MKGFSLPAGVRFSNKQMFAFLVPILFEQFMIAALGVADTVMVSSLGETAVAGVALVNRIDNFAKMFFSALAQGGSVVLSQYIGANNERLAKESLKNNIRIVTVIGFAVMLVMVCFKNGILNLFFGRAEAEVLEISSSYFSITAISYPFVALYYACNAAFRAMGESRITFYAAMAMMGLNLVLKYIFIFLLDFGVSGAAFSTLIAMAFVGIVLLIMLGAKKSRIRLEGLFRLDFNKNISGKILKVSVPNGIEQAMFQLGALAIAGLVSGLGTAAIAADQVARNLCPMILSTSTAFCALMMMVVGQCMGAQKTDEAVMYIKHILKLHYSVLFVNGIIVLAIINPIVSLFNVSDSAQSQAISILALYTIGSCIAYPSSFSVPAALRGAGDTRFVMMVSSASMILFRIGAAYIFIYALDFGVIGTWMAMVSDWLIRTVVFAVRLLHGKWKQNKVI